MNECCKSPKLVVEYRPEIKAEVTTCVLCELDVDYRPLRDIDMPGERVDSVVAEEAALLGLVTRKPVAVTPVKFTPYVPHSGTSTTCVKVGGELSACSAGERGAHKCEHSKWGRLRTFNSPCQCHACHLVVGLVL